MSIHQPGPGHAISADTLRGNDPTQLLNFMRTIRNELYQFRKMLKIVDLKTSKLVEFRFNHVQRRIHEVCKANKRVFVLKTRKLGSSTYALARAFWRALLNPNFTVLILAHTHDAVVKLFRIVERFYENLPAQLKVPLKIGSAHEMLFKHGGGLSIMTASSESARGATTNMIVCSEFAFWKNPEETIASVLQTASPDAEIIIETTANGMNHAHKVWADPTNGFAHHFDNWLEDPNCRSTVIPAYIPPEIIDLAERFGLDDEQINWATDTYLTKCLGNWRTFCQEYGLTADLVFVASGDRVFPDLRYDDPVITLGRIQYEAPNPYGVYSTGIDTATGSANGDYSSWVTQECSNRDRPRIVSTFYGKPDTHEWANLSLEECRRYKSLATIEYNHTGAAVVDHFVHSGYGRQYCRVDATKMADQVTNRLGWSTNVASRPLLIREILRFIKSPTFCVIDPRLQYELLRFVYGPTGKPEADSGCHDDMIMSLGMSFMGMYQSYGTQQDQLTSQRPRTPEEVLAWEKATGKVYCQADPWGDEPTQQDESLDVMGALYQLNGER